MDAAARRAKPNRGRPLVSPNYVSLRDLQELRLKEKEEQRRREEEEAEARRVREEQRKRQEEEEETARRVREEQRKRQEEAEAAAMRFIEERRRRGEEAAARRARDAAAAAPRPEMRASSSSSTSSFRCNERARGGQRLVAVADRHTPPPLRGECAAVKIDGATGGCRGEKGPDGGAANAPLGGSFRAQNVGKVKVSGGIAAGPGEPAAASSHAGKPEEKMKGEDSGCQGNSLLCAMPTRTSNAPGELAKVDIASYRGPTRPNHRHQRKKGLDGRSTETAMTSLIAEAVEASPLPVVNLESKGKSRSGDRSTETASASMPGKAAEASPPRGVKSDNEGKKKPSGGRQASVAPSSDLRDSKKVEALGCDGAASGVSSAPGDQADAGGASYRMPLRPTYRRKWKKGLDGRSTETATTIVATKATDASPLVGVNLEIKGKNGLIDQGTETALARLPGEAADASLARGFKSENKGKKESSGGRHTGMAPSTDWPDGMKAQPCPTAKGSGSHRSNGCQGTTWEAKTGGLQGKQKVVEVKAQQHPATDITSYLRSGGDQGVIQVAKSEGSEGSEEKQRVVEMRTAAQLKPCDMRNSGRQRSGGRSRVNVTARQHDMVWVPKAVAVPDSVEVGKFP